MARRPDTLLLVLGLFACAPAARDPSPWTIEPMPGGHEARLRLAVPARLAVYEMRLNEALVRISPDSSAVLDHLLLPLPPVFGGRSLATLATPTVAVGSYGAGEVYPLGSASAPWDYARVVWTRPVTRPVAQRAEVTWLGVFLDDSVARRPDSAVRAITGTRPEDAAGVTARLASALGVDTGQVRVLARF